MKKIVLLATLIPLTAIPPLKAQTIYVNDTFESDTVGSALSTTSSRLNVDQVTNVANGFAGGASLNAAHYNDTSGTLGGDLEYNAGSSALGGLYVSFDLLNNLGANGSGSGANPIIFGVGSWDTSASAKLNANAHRDFGLEFYQTGTSSTLKIRTNSTALLTTTYDMSSKQSVQIWVNDNDNATLSYVRPDNSTTATLGANSFVIWINGVLVTGESDSGLMLNPDLTAGDATLGRLGFNTSSTGTADFLIDSVLAQDVNPVPEPSAFAILLGGGLLLSWQWRRRKTQY